MFSEEDIEALESFFASEEIPKTIKLHNAITFLDLPKFVTKNLRDLRDGSIVSAVIMPRYHDLLEIKKALSENTP